MMRVAIHQPHYLPWPGYFDKIRQCDLFIYLDNVQFQRRGYQNRNKIKTANGTPWLTVPVHAGRSSRIDEVKIADPKWRRRHAATISNAYANAPYVDLFHSGLRPILEAASHSLADLTIEINAWMMASLGIEVPVLRASALGVSGNKQTLILNLCEHVGATEYLSGEGARSYQERTYFERNGTILTYHTIDIRPYPQCHQVLGFIPHLSMLDLLLNTGPRALDYLNGGLEGQDAVDR